MDIIKIISEHKKPKRFKYDGSAATRVKIGFRRVMATFTGGITRHVDVPKVKV